MAFYIRKGNKVLSDVNTVNSDQPVWSVITPLTNRIVVSAFTTRKDAEVCKSLLNDDEAVISNNLEYIGS